MQAAKITAGEILSATYYLNVVENKGNGEIEVKDQFGNKFTVRGKDLIEKTLVSSTQFDTTEKVNRTQMVELLEGAGDTAFQAVFVKADGNERTMIAKLVGGEPKMGRTNVMDLEVTTGHPLRQIDNRTLSQLILKGTKYTLKK